ncbi:MAG: MotA/TolQ/ExbB proton channel family protein [Planctomycetes bacterium]|nr:MotA/TolQ/ExbB proton channel family protein [Planctomycetota bacterium]MCH9725639.1 MotA/TolQ/ExbB proton channel family protein [Planctomycetota bacterium]MCH9777693.1 MotA/TolQ/ExbB proton channel family protein [Planctomycetota bacterium]MCH9792519.1 MotA/TolQ/ExbB proton channel family protein [Planctomycetota bacterium]MDF1742202.1 MotA/TolQ/ExbB proton channel family protein [Gimesia sp.]
MNAPYTAQESGSDQLPYFTKSKKFWGWVAAVSGIMVVASPFLGIAGTVVGMLRTFEGIGQQADKPVPADLADGISVALLTTAWGLVISSIAVPVFVVALIIYLKRNKSLRTMLVENPPG